MPGIPKEQYDYMVEAKNDGKYANYICNIKCKLGATKRFRVEGSNRIIEMKCTQREGMWTGSHCYILI